MRYLVIIYFLFFYSCIVGQGLPSAWTGSYIGDMQLYGKEAAPFATVLVRQSIQEIKKDSLWTYFMTYGEKDKTGYLEKKYQIVLKPDGLVMDEVDGVLIPMRLFGDCLIDFYSIEDSDNTNSFMSSVLCRQSSGDLEFNLFGGSLTPSNTSQIVEESAGEVFGLSTYTQGFNQHVLLKKIIE
ncbi:MAG: hypothetical protein RL365_594 [Bacteroidota bacterium]|jgi:hypothetical protein